MTSSNRPAWVGFLLMCFAIVGLTGLFASFATSIPVERALIRAGVLDQVLAAERAPDAAQRLAALRPALGDEADAVLSGPGLLWDRVAAARVTMLSEQDREARSVAHRIRIIVGIVTLMGALAGSTILLFAVRSEAANVTKPGVTKPGVAKQEAERAKG